MQIPDYTDSMTADEFRAALLSIGIESHMQLRALLVAFSDYPETKPHRSTTHRWWHGKQAIPTELRVMIHALSLIPPDVRKAFIDRHIKIGDARIRDAP